MLVAKPHLQQTWQTAFHEWAVDSSGYYAALIPVEAELKSIVRTALSSADIDDVERRESSGNVLAMLGLASQRLDKYDAFLQELTQYGLHNPDHIKSAFKSLATVDEAIENSTATRELNRIKTALSKDQDYETNKIIWGLGKLLMFDKVDIMDSRQEKPNHLYVFQKGILQAVELSPKDRRRGLLGYGRSPLSNHPKAQLSVIKIIPGKDITQFINSLDSDEVDYCKEEAYCRSCVIDNEVALIDVTDTTGQKEYSYSTVVHQSGRDVPGFMLVYSVTSRQSFEEITAFYHEILREKDKDYFPMVIVGNRCFQDSKREVTTKEGESLARELGCTFVEVDAKSCDEVEAAFFGLVREVRRYRRNVLNYR
ncbi:hypothetical protein H9Q74_004662 [Fusarium xylarioides]|nr:hypothetical protein H9Q71_005478 [Fusarium xylarioides]KAG5825233.1 hypothetical protein H9Q74_004662 [Fusarium xylarioides]